MRTRHSPLGALPIRPLAACLAIALSAHAFAGAEIADRGKAPQPSLTGRGVKLRPDHPAAQIRTVQNCSDSTTDSLRDIITNPNNPNYAQSGDTVDLSELPVRCGVADSTITLTSGEIAIAQASLTLQGPSADQGTVTISGGGAYRVFEHTGGGMLSIRDLTIADGYSHAASNAYGGCIRSYAPSGESLYLQNTVVAGCTVLSDTGYARGGGIDSSHEVTLVSSTISGSQALGPMKRGFGGGIEANDLTSKYSSISGNVAGDGPTRGGVGGGAYVLKGISMFASTVDHNTASYAGGLSFRSVIPV